MLLKFALIVFSTLIVSIWSYSTGAPLQACENMSPMHQVDPQESDLPYDVLVSSNNAPVGALVNITISGGTFKGYLAQVRNEEGESVGSFEIPRADNYSQTINCFSHTRSTATHKNVLQKDEIVLRWRAPDVPGVYQVFVSVVQDRATFWVRQPSEEINVI